MHLATLAMVLLIPPPTTGRAVRPATERTSEEALLIIDLSDRNGTGGTELECEVDGGRRARAP